MIALTSGRNPRGKRTSCGTDCGSEHGGIFAIAIAVRFVSRWALALALLHFLPTDGRQIPSGGHL